MPLARTRHNTLINSITVTYYSYKKGSYFTLSCLKLKGIGNIKKIKEREVSNKSEKEKPKGKTPP